MFIVNSLIVLRVPVLGSTLANKDVAPLINFGNNYIIFVVRIFSSDG